jgi:hypothetical protein
VRDWRAWAKTVARLRPATINNTLAAIDDFYTRRGLGAATASIVVSATHHPAGARGTVATTARSAAASSITPGFVDPELSSTHAEELECSATPAPAKTNPPGIHRDPGATGPRLGTVGDLRDIPGDLEPVPSRILRLRHSRTLKLLDLASTVPELAHVREPPTVANKRALPSQRGEEQNARRDYGALTSATASKSRLARSVRGV